MQKFVYKLAETLTLSPTSMTLISEYSLDYVCNR